MRAADSRRTSACRRRPMKVRDTRATWRLRRECGTTDDCRAVYITNTDTKNTDI